MTYHRVCNKRKTTGFISGAGTTYPFGAAEFTPVLGGVRLFIFLCSVLYFIVCLFSSASDYLFYLKLLLVRSVTCNTCLSYVA